MCDQTLSKLDKSLAYFLSNYAGNQFTSDKQKLKFQQLIHKLNQSLSKGDSFIVVDDIELAVVKLSNLVCDLPTEVNKPLVLEKNHLYFQKYWHYETTLAQHIYAKAHQPSTTIANTQNYLQQLFATQHTIENKQKLPMQAICNTLLYNFSIICGGPGTGKTSLMVKILLAHLHQEPNTKIMIASPTGKAAARIKQVILKQIHQQPTNINNKFQNILDNTTTIHRLLGYIPMQNSFRHNMNNPIDAELVIIDETSMLNQSLATKLMQALPTNCKIVFIGDYNQLSSVESGSFLKEIYDSCNHKYRIQLTHTFRFDTHIHSLSTAVNERNFAQVKDELLTDTSGKIQWLNTITTGQELVSKCAQELQSYFATVNQLRQDTSSLNLIKQCFECYQQFVILCSNRNGQFGTLHINRQLKRMLNTNNEIWQFGLPVILTTNQPALNLYNGDVGICLYNQSNQPSIVFFSPQDNEPALAYHSASLLQLCETAFAITIHKSQGSEFKKVMIVLPEDTSNRVLSKELLYTAITRSRQELSLVASETVLAKTVNTQIARQSALGEKIMQLNA